MDIHTGMRISISEWWRRCIAARSFGSRRVNGRIIIGNRRSIHGRSIGIHRRMV